MVSGDEEGITVMATTSRTDAPVAAKRRTRRKTEQFVLRMDPEQKGLLEQAAAASGRTVTDIMTEGARRMALQIIREEEELTTWRLSRADAAFFVQALAEERKPTAQMVRDYEAYLSSRASRFAEPGVGEAAGR